MKILQICLKPPLPDVDGGCKAMHAITQGLLDSEIDVKVLTISTQKHPFLREVMPDSYLERTKIEHRFVNTKLNPLNAFLNLFSSKSYNMARFYDKSFEDLIVQTLKATAYDIVLLETLYVTGYIEAIRNNCDAKIIYQAQNIEHEIWELNAKKEKGVKKWYINLLANRLKIVEIANIKKVDAIAAITNKDQEIFKTLGCKKPIITIPFGINIADYPYQETQAGSNVFHIGSMDWLPNQTGIKFLLDEVWEGVLRQFPAAQLHLAGRKMPDWLKSNEQISLKVFGEVDSAIDFINSNNIMVVPLLAGSGMRIKIIEGMALGKTVIATSIAAEGISYTDKKNIVIANSPKEFEDAIVHYLNNENEQTTVGKSARLLMEMEYDNQIIVNKFIAFFKQILN